MELYEDPEHSGSGYYITLPEAIGRMDQSQQTLFDVVRGSMSGFSESDVDLVILCVNDSTETFGQVVGAIISSEELDDAERANTLATIFMGSDIARVDYFKQLAPKESFSLLPKTHEELARQIEIGLSNKSPEEVAMEITQLYVVNLTTDINAVLKAARLPTKTKVKNFLDSASEHVVEVGKMSAAVVIGSLITREILKRQGE
jgi:hypothetical protein